MTGALKRYGRVKKMGLPERYRLFFRAFDTENLKAIVILWLGFPRKEGAKDDCYQVFTNPHSADVNQIIDIFEKSQVENFYPPNFLG